MISIYSTDDLTPDQVNHIHLHAILSPVNQLEILSDRGAWQIPSAHIILCKNGFCLGDQPINLPIKERYDTKCYVINEI